eukprot:CAMPEP_0174239598 /NCGR_PEP_ID=MMETSP0417-20130205/15360_1 /TAXON_ID=242541 /ORGANISM="Mayorella sp, Strain BSH-02190019" /LENGTH=1141 /DNA_ID=CAMNT_0015318559 /DNA_START=130 /DNA_END=3555 /DNA_ORIENTATION=-
MTRKFLKSKSSSSDDPQVSRIRSQGKVLEEQAQNIKDLSKAMSRHHRSTVSHIEEGQQLGSTFMECGNRLSQVADVPQNDTLRKTLKQIGMFQQCLQDMRTKMNQLLGVDVVENLQGFVEGDIRDALHAKKKWEKAMVNREAAEQMLGKYKKGSKQHESAQEKVAETTEQLVRTQQEALHQTSRALEKYNFYAVEQMCAYLQAHYEFFLQGYTFLDTLLPELENYRKEVRERKNLFRENFGVECLSTLPPPTTEQGPRPPPVTSTAPIIIAAGAPSQSNLAPAAGSQSNATAASSSSAAAASLSSSTSASSLPSESTMMTGAGEVTDVELSGSPGTKNSGMRVNQLNQFIAQVEGGEAAESSSSGTSAAEFARSHRNTQASDSTLERAKQQLELEREDAKDGKSSWIKFKVKKTNRPSDKPPVLDAELVNDPDFMDTDSIKFAVDPDYPHPRVRAASLEQLIVRLTHQKFSDVYYRDAFLLTYRSFATPHEVLQGLVKRFNPQCPNNVVRTDERESWLKAKKGPVQFRVVGVLKSWVEQHAYDFLEDRELCTEMEKFIEVVANELPTAAPLLAKFRKSVSQPPKSELLDSLNFDPSRAVTITPETIDPKAFAEALTLVESRLYCAIPPKELLGQAWSKSQKEERAPHILKMIGQFNRVSHAITAMIVSQTKLKSRVALLTKFIAIAEQLMELNNFNGLIEVISGINSSPVRRLKLTWAELDPPVKKLFDTLEEAMSHKSSYKNYRKLLHSVNPPCIPYLGVYLTDLTFLDDGNPDTIDGLINFMKRQKIAEVIGEIRQYQFAEYENITLNPEMHAFVLSLDPIDDEEAYTLSMKVEPRNTGEAIEKMLAQEEQLRKKIQLLQVRNDSLVEKLSQLENTYGSLDKTFRKSQRIARIQPSSETFDAPRAPRRGSRLFEAEHKKFLAAVQNPDGAGSSSLSSRPATGTVSRTLPVKPTPQQQQQQQQQQLQPPPQRLGMVPKQPAPRPPVSASSPGFVFSSSSTSPDSQNSSPHHPIPSGRPAALTKTISAPSFSGSLLRGGGGGGGGGGMRGGRGQPSRPVRTLPRGMPPRSGASAGDLARGTGGAGAVASPSGSSPSLGSAPGSSGVTPPPSTTSSSQSSNSNTQSPAVPPKRPPRSDRTVL